MKIYRQIILFFIVILIIQNTLALTLSPSELKIKNVKLNKNYQFILLISSNEEGLRNFELKSSSDFVKINPNKFMLSEGEKKSIRLSVIFPKNLDNTEGKISIQPYMNNKATPERLSIIYSTGDETKITDSKEPKKTTSIITFFQKKEVLLVVIYGLIGIVSAMILLFILPDIKRTTININKKFSEKINKISKDKEIYKKIKIPNRDSKKIISFEKKINNANKNIEKLTNKIEQFIDKSDKWLKENSDGKYGLE